ncbi:17-beta-hydroxysteroid dehydrogenase 14 isoform X4 [Ranitomeya imitator]|uniref:17-beta-hydroxysteroid dehydrogenase 14 isoform X4 n=1 Tax=Ranitomeya imitator TaxID=111125 RepID=UPI0037E7985D
MLAQCLRFSASPLADVGIKLQVPSCCRGRNKPSIYSTGEEPWLLVDQNQGCAITTRWSSSPEAPRASERQPSGFLKLIDETVKTFGKIDCLINNAGWHPPEQIIDNTSAQDFQDLLSLNLIGYFLTAKYALPHLRKTQGNIINVSSLVGIIGQKHAIPYVATKGAVTAMTKAMAVDESQYNVRVNSISPGNIWTPLWKELSSHSTDPDAMILGGKEAQLLGRMGTAEECASAALFLAAEGTFCTGIDILLTGGAELNYGSKTQQKTRSSIYH